MDLLYHYDSQSFDLSCIYLTVTISPRLPAGNVKLHTQLFGSSLKKSTMTSETYKRAVLQAKEHIMAGDIFQIVLSQRFERRTFADPFEVYRALRVVNPSPYMTYLQVCLLFFFHFDYLFFKEMQYILD